METTKPSKPLASYVVSINTNLMQIIK